jgi:hypothetical protein
MRLNFDGSNRRGKSWTHEILIETLLEFGFMMKDETKDGLRTRTLSLGKLKYLFVNKAKSSPEKLEES